MSRQVVLTIYVLRAALAVSLGVGLSGTDTLAADAGSLTPEQQQVLLNAYPHDLSKIDGNFLTWIDGSQTPIDDRISDKDAPDLLNDADIQDTFAQPYPVGRQPTPPAQDFDPGRARNTAFLKKVYGDCNSKDYPRRLTDVAWLPKKSGGSISFNTSNGAARQLQKVSEELDKLPAVFNDYLVPAITTQCREIGGTERSSAHAFGIAIDLNPRYSHYWRRTRASDKGLFPYANAMPFEIVEIFERHGFIWGGKWYHYDTMHFEYRPELLPQRQ